MTIAVTGGAGYIGSHMVRLLLSRGLPVAVIDDFSTGHADAVPREVPLLRASIADRAAVASFLRAQKASAIVHFAARALVGESVQDPRLYWRDNLAATVALLEAALEAQVRRFVLSSTCAVYGTPSQVPIPEEAPKAPINPYGATKLAIERMLSDYAAAYDFRFVALRYFNAAGAEPEHGLGERHAQETHLIPLILRAALGKRPQVEIFGTDYPTPDGTCIRDYVHVSDLAEAHLLALDFLDKGGQSQAFNLGTGRGASVREVIAAARQISGKDIRVAEAARRPGDPAALVAFAGKAEELLGWRARKSSLETIVRDAWQFHSSAR